MSFPMSYGMSFMSFRADETTNIKSNSLQGNAVYITKE